MKIIWINVNGLNSNLRGRSIGDFLDEFMKSEYDCIMVQEPRYKIDKQNSGSCNWESLCKMKKMTALFTANEKGSGGVATIWKNATVETKIEQLQMTEIVAGEAILSCFTMQGEAFAVCNMYASSANREDERGKLFRTLGEVLPEAPIIGGDFNIVLDTVQDLRRPDSTVSEYSNGAWDDLMIMSRHLGIRDGWREQVGPSRVQYTHTVHNNIRGKPNEFQNKEQEREAEAGEESDKGPITCQSRLDFILAPDPEVISPQCNVHGVWA